MLQRISMLTLSLLCLGLMSACSKEEREQIKSDVNEVKESVKETASQVSDASKEAAEKAKQMAQEGYEEAKNAPDLKGLDSVQSD